ncbi:MAG: NifB/NifX family molybdenum-iron cluster-binding protein [Eubacteriales bacterium]
MKIAVTTDGEQIFQHFGQCSIFTVFTVVNAMITDKKILDASASGHAALAPFLKSTGADVVICGGIGGGARQMLSEAGIKLISGMEGNIEDAVAKYIKGELNDMGGSCSHHDNDAGHNCECENHCH